MSLTVRLILSAMRAVKKTGLIKGPDANLDAEIRKAKEYNRKHPYIEPKDRKAAYQTIYAGKLPCLVIRPENSSSLRKAILFLHGGGDRDTWKPEVAFARTYGKRAGMDVFYPIYPPFTEASLVETADLIFQVYQKITNEFGAGNVAVIGGSYGGLLAMQLLTWINRSNAVREHEGVDMPRLLIMNSPFGYLKTDEEWALAERLEREDPLIPVGAFRYMLDAAVRADPNTPDYALYPENMDFHNAPETYVFYAEEACAAAADAIKRSYERDGVGDRLHMHIEPGMMHCYASAPVFKESRRDFNKQIELLKRL